MAAYLTIDIGNTSVKARLWRGISYSDSAAPGPFSPLLARELLSRCPADLDAIAVSNVGASCPEAMEILHSGPARVIIVTAATPLPIRLGPYGLCATLGPDRIAALCGAQERAPERELLVVDCGTAITYDRLSASGDFLGGNIAPGPELRLRALHEHTARLPLPQLPAIDEPHPMWGTSTSEAMLAGTLRGIAAEIEYYTAATRGDAILTGGFAPLISTFLPSRPALAPALVMEGLKCIITHNENLR